MVVGATVVVVVVATVVVVTTVVVVVVGAETLTHVAVSGATWMLRTYDAETIVPLGSSNGKTANALTHVTLPRMSL